MIIDELAIGDFVKISFRQRERMWIKVTEIDGDTAKGTLANHPMTIEELSKGDEVSFELRNIVDYQKGD